MSRPGTPIRRRAPLLALLATAPLAAAQDSATGALRLRGPTPATSLTLQSLQTGRQRTLPAPSTAQPLLLPALAPGPYRLTLLAGPTPIASLDLTVSLGTTTDVPLPEHLQAATEAVTVTATDDTSASTTALIPRAELQLLPLAGRRWQALAVLTPELNLSTAATPDLLSTRGLPSTQNSSTLDGLSSDQSYTAAPAGSGRDTGPETEDETEAGQGSARPAASGFNAGSGPGRHPGMAYTFPESAVQEFRITGQNDSALTGHAAGAIINTVTRSGSPELHGSVFYLNRSDLLAARDSFTTVTHFHDGAITTLTAMRPHDLRQQFGATLGGPVRLPHPQPLFSRLQHTARTAETSVRAPATAPGLTAEPPTEAPSGPTPPKLLFFYAFNAQRRGFPAISSPQSPTFYALTPTQSALLGNRGVTQAQTTAALNYLDSLTGTAPRRQDQTIHFGKLSWLPSDRDRLSLQYNRARSLSPGGSRTGAVVNRGLHSFGNLDTRVDAVLARWVHAPSSFWSFELRAQYGRDLHLERPESPLPQEPAVSPGGYSPEVSIGPEGLLFGTPASTAAGPAPDERRSEAAAVLTLAPGRHLLQLGADLSHITDHLESLPNQFGTFLYDSGTTRGYAGGLVDWISDFTFNVNHSPNGACPSINSPIHYFCFRSFSQSFGSTSTRFSTSESAAFLQDSWRLHPRLSLSAGLRYEYELLPLPQHPNFDLDQVFAPFGATSVFPEDRNNLGPRLGLAWQPLRRTTLRAAYGLYFGRLPGATVRAALNSTALPSSTERIRITPTTITSCPQVPNQGFGYPCAFTGATSAPAGVVSTTAAVLFSRRFRLPTAQQADLSLEHTLHRGTLLRLAGHLTLTHQLPNSTDINIAPSTATRSFILQTPPNTPGAPNGQTFALPLYTARLDSAYGPVTAILSNANSSYAAGVAELRSRLPAGVTLHTTYTVSRTVDTGPNAGAVPVTNGQLDPFSIGYDKAVSTFNIPQKLVTALVWSPKPAAPTPLRRALLSGWSLAPVLVATSGRPYTYNIFGGTRLPGGHESLNGSGGAVYLPTIGRNTLRLPPQLHLDLRLDRELHTSDNSTLRLSAEAFNLPNRNNLTAVAERAFLVGTPGTDSLTPLVFQNSAAIAAEGLNTNPFATPLYSGRESQARQLQLSATWQF